MALVRLIVIGGIVLTVVYFVISIYSRSVRREKLEKEWDANPKGDAAAREAFIEEGMAAYEGGFRKKLILLVYIVPTILLIATYFIRNTNGGL